MKRKCLLILGMHRSGTSAVAGAIYNSNNSIEFTNNLLGATKDNNKGHFENRSFVELNDEILRSVNLTWDTTLNPLISIDDKQKKAYKSRIAEILEKEYTSENLIAIKDPRISILLPLYLDVLEQQDFEICLLSIIRNPLDVAKSLQRRNNITIENGLKIWAFYNRSIELNSRQLNQAWFGYDNLIQGNEQTIGEINKYLKSISFVSDGLNMSFLDKGLQNNASTSEELNSSVPFIYQSLFKQLSKAKLNTKVLDDIYSELIDGRFFNELNTTIYFDSGNGFNEKESQIFTIQNIDGYFKFSITFPKDKTVQKLRWDPLERRSLVYIKSLIIEESSGKKNISPFRFSSNGRSLSDDVFYFETSDPQFYFESNEKLESVEIAFQIIADNSLIESKTLTLLSQYQLGENLVDNINQLKQILNNQTEEFNRKVDHFTSLVVQLEDDLSAKDKIISEKENFISEQKNELSQKENLISNKEEDIAQLKLQELERLRELEKLDILYRNEQNKVSELTISLNEGKQKIQELENYNEDQNSQIIDLLKRISALEERKVNDFHHIRNLEGEISKLHQAVQDMRLINRLKRIILFWR